MLEKVGVQRPAEPLEDLLVERVAFHCIAVPIRAVPRAFSRSSTTPRVAWRVQTRGGGTKGMTW